MNGLTIHRSAKASPAPEHHEDEYCDTHRDADDYDRRLNEVRTNGAEKCRRCSELRVVHDLRVCH